MVGIKSNDEEQKSGSQGQAVEHKLWGSKQAKQEEISKIGVA